MQVPVISLVLFLFKMTRSVLKRCTEMREALLSTPLMNLKISGEA
jgi:hypothetical protein